MKLTVISFTKKGMELSKRVKDSLCIDIDLYAKYKEFDETENGEVTMVTEGLTEWTLKHQEKGDALLFIGAMGICIRAISQGVKDKLSDAPVLVMDELGRYVIPVLAGHMGGANELALMLSDRLKAIPVITTATDLEGAFSVDLFAKENHLSIYNRDGIARVSAKALEGKPIRLSVENFPPETTDVLISSDTTFSDRAKICLCPKDLAVGIGCKKGTSYESLSAFLSEVFNELGIEKNQIGAIASIDLKAEEEGLILLCRKLSVPFITFSAQILEKAAGEFTESDFVRETTGVGNVCERSAMVLAGNRGEFVLRKKARDGMTIAIVKVP